MINLLITVVLTSSLYLIFKAFEVFKIRTFQAVVANYITCVVVGSIYSFGTTTRQMQEDLGWVYFSLYMGLLFISAFYLMAWSAQKIGVTVSTVASKMSLIVPVLFSFIYLKVAVDNWLIYVFGLVLGIISIVLATHKPKEIGEQSSIKNLLIALVVFILTGTVDTSINLVNAKYSHLASFTNLFPITVFATASMFGCVILAVNLIKKGERLEGRSLLAGVLLGVPNYFSIYFLMSTLSNFNENGAVVFPLANMMVILLSSIFAWLLFKETLRTRNILGLFCAVGAIVLISLDAIKEYLATIF